METDKQIPPPLAPGTITTETSDPLLPDEARVSTTPVVVQIGPSSPTLVPEPDSPLETGTDVPSHHGDHQDKHHVKFFTGDGEEEREEGERGDDVIGKEKGEVGEKENKALDFVGGLHEDNVNEVVVEREGGGGEIQAGSIMQSMETITGVNFDLPEAPLLSHSSTPTSPLLPTTMETVALGIQDVIEAEVMIGGEEMGESLQLPEELSAVGGMPLQLNEPAKTEEEEEMNTVGGLQLEMNGLKSRGSGGDGAHLLDVREVGVGPPSTSPLSHPAIEVSSPPSAIPTHLSHPLISLPLPPPQFTSSLHGDGEEESQTLGREGVGDIGPEPRVLPPVPSPYPEEVAGVKEALYTAWVPSPWTLGLLSRRTPVDQSHLTCPGLVADIKMVRTYHF